MTEGDKPRTVVPREAVPRFVDPDASSLWIRPARWPDDLVAARALLHSYCDYLIDNPVASVPVDVKARQQECDNLPARYPGTATGTLFVAELDGAIVGCMVMRLLPGREAAAEVQRLFVADAARGHGAGGALLQQGLLWAKQMSANEVLLDTVPTAMPSAVRLYQAAGFVPVPPYHADALPGMVWYRRPLR